MEINNRVLISNFGGLFIYEEVMPRNKKTGIKIE